MAVPVSAELVTVPWWRRPAALNLAIIAYIAGSSYLVYSVPRSILAFMLFQGSLLALYYLPIAVRVKVLYAAVTLGLLMPFLGTINGYYMEVAIQVGLAGLLDLGYVAFYAVGAYTWAIFGSPQANQFISEALIRFPLSPGWFFVFLVGGVIVAAITGVLLGLPVLRVRGDYLAIVTLGFGEVIRVLANNLDKPINFTNGPIGITPVGRPPLFFAPFVERLGLPATPPAPYPLYFYFLVLLVVGIVIVVTQRFKDSHIGRAWEAIREDEAAAIAMGVPLIRSKLLAFA